MFKRTLLLIALGVTFAHPAQAGIWQVDIDTTAISGIDGYLDLQFNPGGADAQPLQVQISKFSSDATLGSAMIDGVVSGSLLGTLILNNTAPLNSWLQGMVFGSHIAFTLDMAETPKTGSGSSFATLLWDANFNPLLAAAGGIEALRIDLTPTLEPGLVASSSVQASAVPEPNMMSLMGLGLGLLGLAAVRRHKQR